MSVRIENDDVADLPPSAKLVYYHLQSDAPSTQQEIAAATALPIRTVRYALERLDEVGAVASEPNFEDTRQKLYRPVDPS